MSAPTISYTHVCTVDEIEAVDERDIVRAAVESGHLPDFAANAVLPDWSARDVAQSTFDMLILVAWRHVGWHEPLMNLGLMLAYSEWCTSKHRHFKRRKPVEDVEDLVRRWHDTLVQMSTAHDHAAFTGAEHSTDDLLKPLLDAPIAQLREFAAKLATRLEEDPRVPFLVWSSFRQVVAPLILKRPEGEVLELKTSLAREVAERVAQDIPREDLIAAIAGALQWRAVESLQQTRKAVVEQGAKPRMTGRQSCLFLTTVDPAGKELSRVIL